MANIPAPDLLDRLLTVDAEAGRLWWKPRGKDLFRDYKGYQESYCNTWNMRYAGKEAFNRPNGLGYLYGTIFGQNFMTHRIIWTMHYGEEPNLKIDHINRDKTDNRISNLRLASDTQNQANTQAKRTGLCPYKGVSFHVSNGRWISNIRENGKRLHLGYFDTAEEAALAYDAAALRIHGAFAFTNFCDKNPLAI